MKSEIDFVWKRYGDGDQSAFDTIYNHYQRRLFAYCIGKLKDIELAENMVADIFIKLLEQPDPGSIQQLENWLFTVARNACNSYWSKHNRRSEILEEIGDAFQLYEAPRVLEEIDMATFDELIKAELKESDYILWKLSFEGYANHEIAERLGMTEKTTANRKALLKGTLRSLLNKHLVQAGK